MKKLLFIFVLLCTLVLGSVSWETNASKAVKKQRAVTQFDQAVMVNGVTLNPGRYLFVHNDAAMTRGETCTFIYKGEAEITGKLVVSFHCTPAERTKADHFTIRSVQAAPGVVEVREFQFTGDTEAHLVPAK